MKALSFAILTLLAITTGCDDRPDFLRASNNAPIVYFNGVLSQIQVDDSLKNSLKIGQDYIDVIVSAVDREGGLSGFTVSGTASAAEFFIGSEPMSGNIPLEGSSATVRIKPNTFGVHSFSFVANDHLGGSGVGTYNLFIFDNLPPTANCVFTNTQVSSPFEYEFNASASVDQDKAFGGSIQFYKYIINEDSEIISPNPIIKHVFPGTGGYTVKYSVIDNEGRESAIKTQLITLI